MTKKITWQGFPLTKETLAKSPKVLDELQKYLDANRGRLMAAGVWGKSRVDELESVIKEANDGKGKRNRR